MKMGFIDNTPDKIQKAPTYKVQFRGSCKITEPKIIAITGTIKTDREAYVEPASLMAL